VQSYWYARERRRRIIIIINCYYCIVVVVFVRDGDGDLIIYYAERISSGDGDVVRVRNNNNNIIGSTRDRITHTRWLRRIIIIIIIIIIYANKRRMCVCGVLTYNIIYIYYYVLGVPTRLRHPFFPRARNLVITIVVVVVVVVILYIRKRKRVLKIRDYESSVPLSPPPCGLSTVKNCAAKLSLYIMYIIWTCTYVTSSYIILLYLRCLIIDFCRNYITPLFFLLSTGFCFSRLGSATHTYI